MIYGIYIFECEKLYLYTIPTYEIAAMLRGRPGPGTRGTNCTIKNSYKNGEEERKKHADNANLATTIQMDVRAKRVMVWISSF